MRRWKRFRQRLRDMRTLKNLGLDAENIAAKMYDTLPGAEHYVLASLNLPEKTAKQSVLCIDVNPDSFRSAIDEQYDNALREIGIDPLEFDTTERADDSELRPGVNFKAKEDVTTLFAQMKKVSDASPDAPLLGAHVVIAASHLQRGVVARAFDTMHIDRSRLIQSAQKLVANASTD